MTRRTYTVRQTCELLAKGQRVVSFATKKNYTSLVVLIRSDKPRLALGMVFQYGRYMTFTVSIHTLSGETSGGRTINNRIDSIQEEGQTPNRLFTIDNARASRQQAVAWLGGWDWDL